MTQGGRPWSGRLSVEHHHRPVRAENAPRPVLATDQAAASTRAEATVHGLTRGAEPAEADHLRGLFELTVGQLDGAIEHLRAASLAPSGGPLADAAIHADLAVALLTRWNDGRRTGVERPLDWLDALDAIEQAVTLAPNDPAIRFDRALILDRGSLRHLARTAWQDYLDRSADDDPGWIREAQQHLRRLDEPTVRERFLAAWNETLGSVEAGDPSGTETLVEDFPFFARLWTEEHLMPAWGAEPAATWRLDLARRIAAALATERGDHLLADAIVAIESASPASRASLAEAHRRYGEGMKLYRKVRLDAAESDLVAARDGFASEDSPFVDWADFYLAICDFDDGSVLLFENLALQTDLRYPSLVARAHWLYGTALGSDEHFDPALERYAIARRLLHDSAGPVEAWYVDTLDTEIHSMRGEIDATWRSGQRALERVTHGGRPRRVHATLNVLVQALLREDRPALAMLFLDELAAAYAAWDGDRPAVHAEVLAERARAHRALENLDAARRDLRAAIDEIERQQDDIDSKQRGWVGLYEGHLLLESDPDRAVEVLTDALGDLEDKEWTFGHARHLVARARAHRLRGDLDAEHDDLTMAIARYEATREETPEPSVRTRHFRLAQPAFDRLIERAEDLSDGSGLAVFERSRARFLRDRRDASAVTTSPLPQHLADTIVIAMAALDDEVIAWVFDDPERKFPRTVRLPWQKPTRKTMLDSLHQQLTTSRSANPTTQLEMLYATLIEPLDLPDDGRRLAIIADRELAEVPFTALRHPTSGRYLIEDRPIHLLPSVAFLDDPNRSQPETTPSVLAVDGSEFVRQSGLTALPLAADEAQAVAALYPAGTLLYGAQATRAALLAAIEHHAVLHVSAHAIAQPLDPGRSRLFLAPIDPEDDGALLAHELWNRDLRHLDLVMLSACGSMVGQGPGREALFGLAGGFFAAGARQVVATLWDTESQAAHALGPRFHQHYLDSRDAGIAWRRTVVEILDDSSARWLADPAAWAPFAVLGPPSDGVEGSVH
ncbi:MAG: CHAT domain-containing protein [Acidobacteriota bacterium]